MSAKNIMPTAYIKEALKPIHVTNIDRSIFSSTFLVVHQRHYYPVVDSHRFVGNNKTCVRQIEAGANVYASSLISCISKRKQVNQPTSRWSASHDIIDKSMHRWEAGQLHSHRVDNVQAQQVNIINLGKTQQTAMSTVKQTMTSQRYAYLSARYRRLHYTLRYVTSR